MFAAIYTGHCPAWSPLVFFRRMADVTSLTAAAAPRGFLRLVDLSGRLRLATAAAAVFVFHAVAVLLTAISADGGSMLSAPVGSPVRSGSIGMSDPPESSRGVAACRVESSTHVVVSAGGRISAWQVGSGVRP